MIFEPCFELALNIFAARLRWLIPKWFDGRQGIVRSPLLVAETVFAHFTPTERE